MATVVTVRQGVISWWFPPMPVSRVAAIRFVLYLFIPIYIAVFGIRAPGHSTTPPSLFHPLFAGRLLHLPRLSLTESHVLLGVLLVACLLAAVGFAASVSGIVVFFAVLEWQVVGMSGGKVNHSWCAFLVVLAILPFAGRARLTDRRRSEAAGWTVRFTQVTVVMVYFLSACAKIRYSGLATWANSSVFMRAVVQNSGLGQHWLIVHPQVLHAAQWGLVLFELFSPLALLVLDRPRLRYVAAASFLLFHLVTWVALNIQFLAQMVCVVAALVPLDDLASTVRARISRPAVGPSAVWEG